MVLVSNFFEKCSVPDRLIKFLSAFTSRLVIFGVSTLKSNTPVFPVIHQSYQTFSGDFFQSFWLQCVFTLARSNDVLKEPGLCSHAIVISTKLLFQPSSCQTRVNHANEVYIHVSRYLSERGRSLGFFTTREEST